MAISLNFMSSCLALVCGAPGIVFGEGNSTPLQYSCLENPMGGGAWWAAVHEVAGSWAQLSDFTFTFRFHALEKEMATHSSVLAWRIPGTEEPGGLPSMGSHRVRHDWSNLAAAGCTRHCSGEERLKKRTDPKGNLFCNILFQFYWSFSYMCLQEPCVVDRNYISRLLISAM